MRFRRDDCCANYKNGEGIMRVAIIGSGYVGLVTGACLADCGHEVVCVDKDVSKISRLQQGLIPIYELGLKEIVDRNASAGRLFFTADLDKALEGSEVAFIAVGTPPRAGDGVADLRYVMSVAEDVARAARHPLVLVTKSTVPVGTGDRIERIIQGGASGIVIDVISNPEFLREGDAIADFMNPDRIVIGSQSPAADKVMRNLYSRFIGTGTPIVHTTRRTAELIKYASNAFLAMKVTFINEMADLCEGTGADVSDVALGMGLDQRIGPKFLRAGPGFGGSCFPKDILALLKCANDAGTSMRLVENTIGINEARKRAMARRVADALGGDIYGKKIAVLGLAFKPETDDMRDSPAITIIRALQDQGAMVAAADPKAGEEAQSLFPDVEISSSALRAAMNADAVVLLTEWMEFKALSPSKLASVMKGRVAVDLRNAWDATAFAAEGFDVFRVGAAPLLALQRGAEKRATIRQVSAEPAFHVTA
jgi:UDPglucose 6-dehydrogenase